MKLASAAVSLLLVLSIPVRAQVADPLGTITDPADRAVLVDILPTLTSRRPEIDELDAALGRLPRPTPLRGWVQIMRAEVLSRSQDFGLAVHAIEEALRLLPDDPRPKLAAFDIFTFSGSPQRAADLWMQASRESPDLARTSDRYVIMALIGRLREIGDLPRADRLNARLADIGFGAGLAPERSDAALARVREAVRLERDEEAQAAVTAIGDPTDLQLLYIDRRYAALWPRIAEWAGPDLSAQTLRYLEELRADWTAANDLHTAAPYARRLSQLDGHAAVVGLFQPILDGIQPGTALETLDGAEYVAPIVARSLARLDRVPEAKALLARISAALPAQDNGARLNLDWANIRFAADALDWPQVIARSDRFLDRARELGDTINRAATVQAQAWRACALARVGRAEEAQQATLEVLASAAKLPGLAMDMLLCRGDAAAAQLLLITRLRDEQSRGWALRFVQPKLEADPTPLGRAMQGIAQTVRTAPDVLEAVEKVGRVLPKPIEAALPPGFDPFRAAPRSTPLGPDAI